LTCSKAGHAALIQFGLGTLLAIQFEGFVLQDMEVSNFRRNVTVEDVVLWQAAMGEAEEEAEGPAMTPTEKAEAFLEEASPVYKNYTHGYSNVIFLAMLAPVRFPSKCICHLLPCPVKSQLEPLVPGNTYMDRPCLNRAAKMLNSTYGKSLLLSMLSQIFAAAGGHHRVVRHRLI
jgi:hypothetical protein